MSLVERLREDAVFARRAVLVVTLVGILVRIPFLTAPIADRQSWNQCSTATVIRNFATKDFDLFHPQWDVLDPGTTEPNIEAEEAPIYSGAAALLYRLFGAGHAWPRLLSILGMALGGLFLFRLGRRLFDPATGVLGLVLWQLGPYPWFFGRTIMSDPWMLAASIAAADYFHKWLERDETADLYKAGLATCLAGLFKAFSLHIGILFLIAAIWRRGPGVIKDKRLYIFGAISLALPLAWIWYASRIGSLGNVLAEPGGTIAGAPHLWGDFGLLFKPEFWAKIQSRVFDRSLTPVVTLLAGASLVFSATRKKSGYLWLWMFSVLCYVMIVRSGNLEHNYYQLPFTPPLALLAGAGLTGLTQKAGMRISKDKFLFAVLLVFLVVSGLYVRAEYRQDLSSVRAGELAREFSAPGDILLVLDPGATRKNQVLYHANRRGWHVRRLNAEGVEKYRKWGADFAVVCLSKDQIDRGKDALVHLGKNYSMSATASATGDGRVHLINIFSLKTKQP